MSLKVQKQMQKQSSHLAMQRQSSELRFILSTALIQDIRTLQSSYQVVLIDNQDWETLFSTHFFSASFDPIRSANVSRVSLRAAFGCFGNLFRLLASPLAFIQYA